MNTSFMIGCGGEFIPLYPTGNSLNITNSDKAVTRRTFPEAWWDKNIVAFKVRISATIIVNDKNVQVTNHNAKANHTNFLGEYEITIVNEISADSFDNPYYTFNNVNRKSKFWVFTYQYSHGYGWVAQSPISYRPLRDYRYLSEWYIIVDWDLNKKYFEVSSGLVVSTDISWEPVYA